MANLKHFVINGTDTFGVATADLIEKWIGKTTFLTSSESLEGRIDYFNLQRKGKLIYQK